VFLRDGQRIQARMSRAATCMRPYRIAGAAQPALGALASGRRGVFGIVPMAMVSSKRASGAAMVSAVCKGDARRRSVRPPKAKGNLGGRCRTRAKLYCGIACGIQFTGRSET